MNDFERLLTGEVEIDELLLRELSGVNEPLLILATAQ